MNNTDHIQTREHDKVWEDQTVREQPHLNVLDAGGVDRSQNLRDFDEGQSDPARWLGQCVNLVGVLPVSGGEALPTAV